MHDVFGVEPVAVDLFVQSGLVTGVDSVPVREGGDCFAVDVVAGGDVAQRHPFLPVEGGELFRRQCGGQGRDGGCCRGGFDMGRVQGQHVANGLGCAVELPGHCGERLSVFDEVVQRRNVDGVGIGAGQLESVEEPQRWLPGDWFGDTRAVQELVGGVCSAWVAAGVRRAG